MEESKCIVETCKSALINLFCPPTDENVLKKWQEILGTTESYFLVCENHFSSKDVIIEKCLEPLAVPSLLTIEDTNEVGEECCGMCLEKMNENKFPLSKDKLDNFHTLTGFKPAKESICENCEKFLQTYQKFKTDIKEKHKQLKSKEVQELSDEDDCVMVSEEKSMEKSTNVAEKEPQNKISYPKLPPAITAKIKTPGDAKNTKKQFICKHCYYKTDERHALIDHIDINHYFPCDLCPFISSNKPLQTFHFNKYHSADPKSIICGICVGKKFNSRDEVNEHYEKDHSSQACSYFMCFYCKSNCSTPAELKYHYNQFHSGGLSTANQQVNNTKLQVALMVNKKDKSADVQQPKNYKEIMKKIKSSVTVKRIGNKKCSLPINTPIKIANKLPPVRKSRMKPKPKRNITEVTIVSSRSKSQYFEESVDSPQSISDNSNDGCPKSDDEIIAEYVSDGDVNIADDAANADDAADADDDPKADAISISSSDSDYFGDKEIAKKTPTKEESIKNALKRRVTNIKAGNSFKSINSETASNGKTFRCLSCSEYFEDIAKLLEHRENSHPSENASKTYEEFDSETTKKLYPADRKKPVHDPNAPKVACDICNIKVQERNLQKHRMKHTDSKQFLCDICSKTFLDVTAFKYHMLKHDPEQHFQCDMCSKTWVTKPLLLKHIKRSHLRVRLVQAQCSICNKKFYKQEKSSKNRLEKHMTKYHPDGKDDGYRVNEETNFYDCDKCGASYWDIYTFSRHSCEKGRLQIRCTDCLTPCSSVKSLEKHKTLKCRKLNPFTNIAIQKEVERLRKINEQYNQTHNHPHQVSHQSQQGYSNFPPMYENIINQQQRYYFQM